MQWKWKTDASSSSFSAPEEEEGGITILFLLLPGARRGKRGKYGTQSAIQRTVCTHPVCAREREGERGKEGSEVKELSQPGTQQAGLARRGEQTKSRARALSLETFSLSLSIDLPTYILKTEDRGQKLFL